MGYTDIRLAKPETPLKPNEWRAIPERYRIDEFDQWWESIGSGITPEYGDDQWWESIGSGITPEYGDDHEEHAKRIAEIAWKAATEAANER
jgi:hypothetical protein